MYTLMTTFITRSGLKLSRLKLGRLKLRGLKLSGLKLSGLKLSRLKLSCIAHTGLVLSCLVLSRAALAENSVGEFEYKDSNVNNKTALLLDTRLSGEVNGMVASITMDQIFKNDTNDWINGRYVFPLPEGAAVDSLRLQIGERVINGVIKEKAQAKKTYEAAKKAGKKAGLLEQHRPNLFSVSIANIGPGESINAQLTFVDKVAYDNGVFSLRLPTTLTPRYIPGAPITLSEAMQESLTRTFEEQQNVEINTATGWSPDTDRISDASLITPPQEHGFGAQTTHHFSLDLSINSGIALQRIVSDTHALNSKALGKDRFNVSLSNITELMNSDLVMTWQPIIGKAPKAALFQQAFDDAYYSMILLTPPQVDTGISLPRDITFVIDSSGSMSGASMRQAKQALHDGLTFLTPNDKFNIVDFDSRFRPMFDQSRPVTERSLNQARVMIDSLSAGGGTRMLGALEFALGQPQDSAYLRQLVFVTDGAIGNETELFKLINDKLGDTRLFTVGIGRAPNSYFMNKAAKFGRGSYTYIGDLREVSEKMAALFNKITRPVMRNVTIDWPQQVEQYPQRIPDLYAGEPITLVVKSKTPIKHVKASGELLNTPWKQTLKVGRYRKDTDNLDTVWARQKVADLMDKLATGDLPNETVKPEVTRLGISHHILTKYTSFVAVEETISRPQHEKAKHKTVPNLMPKGNTMSVPQTATPASILTIMGGLMILLGGVLRRRQQHQTSKQGLEA